MRSTTTIPILNWRPISLVLFCALATGFSLHAAEVKETYPDGKVKVRYTVDEAKRRIGVYLEYHPSGKIKLRGQYALGKKMGLWISYDEKTGRTLESWTWRNDLLDGPYVWNFPSGEPGIKATYRQGELNGPMIVADEKDRFLRRISYPHTREAVEKAARSLFYSPIPDAAFAAQAQVKSPYKAGAYAPDTLTEALNATKLYRFLCGVPWQEMKVDAALCDKSAHAAVLLAKEDKDPTRMPEAPSDMDKGFLGIAMAGLKDGNLHRGSNNPTQAVLSFMDNSEEKDMGKLEYRQWMLSPGLQKVGFGSARRFVVMDVSDGARPAKADYNFIAYPGEGYFPRVLLDAKSNWSLFINNSKAKVAKDSLSITVQKVDEHFQAVGAVLNTEIVGSPAAMSPAFGWSVIVFKTELPSMDAARYWVGVQGVQTLAGVDAPFGYLVDLIDVPLSEKVIAKAPEPAAPAPPSAEEVKKKKIELGRTFLGKTVPDLQFAGRRAKLVSTESDNSRTFQIDDPGEPTQIRVTTDPDGKIILVIVNGTVIK
jgi:hypothetical protein